VDRVEIAAAHVAGGIALNHFRLASHPWHAERLVREGKSPDALHDLLEQGNSRYRTFTFQFSGG